MNIGIESVDSTSFPNLALMKISAFHKAKGDKVEWASPLFDGYDRVYKSKVFSFSPDTLSQYQCEVIKGGTGYSIESRLPREIELTHPDYSIYPQLDNKTAYGFLTRGCPNKCKWCVVPKKEGAVHPYMDVDEIAINGRNNLVLMDNNVLASDYGLEQIVKIVDRKYKVDFNQGLDARLITPEIADLLARVKWSRYIRLGMDSISQIPHVLNARKLLRDRGYKKDLFCYFLISDVAGVKERLDAIYQYKDIAPFGQPYRDYNNPHQIIPQWQKDFARWMNRKWIYKSIPIEEYKIDSTHTFTFPL